MHVLMFDERCDDATSQPTANLTCSDIFGGGAQVHLNYTVSHCPPNSHVLVYLNDVQLGGEDAYFW